MWCCVFQGSEEYNLEIRKDGLFWSEIRKKEKNNCVYISKRIWLYVREKGELWVQIWCKLGNARSLDIHVSTVHKIICQILYCNFYKIIHVQNLLISDIPENRRFISNFSHPWTMNGHEICCGQSFYYRRTIANLTELKSACFIRHSTFTKSLPKHSGLLCILFFIGINLWRTIMDSTWKLSAVRIAIT